jgi:hypothetical protein
MVETMYIGTSVNTDKVTVEKHIEKLPVARRVAAV